MNDTSMPTIPTTPAPLTAPAAPLETAPAPLTAPVVESPAGELNPPAHEEEKIKITNPDDDNASVVPVPLTKQVISVVATRKGFYGQQRIVSGQPFSVANFEALGEWMTCTCPEMEKKRVAHFKERRKKAKK